MRFLRYRLSARCQIVSRNERGRDAALACHVEVGVLGLAMLSRLMLSCDNLMRCGRIFTDVPVI